MTADRIMLDPMIRGVPTTRSALTIRGKTGQTTSPFRQITSSRSGPLHRTISSRTGQYRQAISSRTHSEAGRPIQRPTGAISRTSSRSRGPTSPRLRRLQIEAGRTSARDSRAATARPPRTGQRRLNTTLRLNSGRHNVRSARLRLRSKTGRSRPLRNSGHLNVRSARRLRLSSTRLRRNVRNRSMRTGRLLRRVPLNGRGRTRSLHRRQDRSRTTGQIKNRKRTRKTRSPTRARKAEAAAHRRMCGGLRVFKLRSAPRLGF